MSCNLWHTQQELQEATSGNQGELVPGNLEFHSFVTVSLVLSSAWYLWYSNAGYVPRDV